MTNQEFEALAQLMRLRGGPAKDAARFVLVDGMRPADAAAALGLSPASVSNAVNRVRRSLELARVACGQP